MLKQFLNNLKKLDLEDAYIKAVNSNQDEILELNKQQLFEGRDANGDSLEPYQSNSYANYKLKFNPLGVTDLKLTGEFYRGFFLNAPGFPITFDSRDSKTSKLKSQYGEIFGLDKASLEQMQQIVLPDFQKEIRSVLDL